MNVLQLSYDITHGAKTHIVTQLATIATHFVTRNGQKLLKNKILGAKSTSIRDCVGRSVRPSVRPSVHPPRCAITWKTSYVAIASRRGGGRGN
jgi:hypothetical protein